MAGVSVVRDSLGVVGQYSTAWQRLKAAGQQGLVVASVSSRGQGGGERRLLKRLQGVGSSFGVSPDGRLLGLLEKGGGGGQDHLTVFEGPFAPSGKGELDRGRLVRIVWVYCSGFWL